MVSNENGCVNTDTIIVWVTDTGIEEAEKFSFIKIYPNPITNELNVSFENNHEKVTLAILNLNDKALLNKEIEQFGENDFKLDVSEFESGVYLLLVKKSHQVFTHRIIIER